MSDQRFPLGCTIDSGRYRLEKLLRCEPEDGFWLGSRLPPGMGEVFVTVRRIRPGNGLEKFIDYAAPGIQAPLFYGPLDDARRLHTCVVDEIPPGVDLMKAGQLSLSETLHLGIALCETLAGWADHRGGMISDGLRPDTVFVDGDIGRREFSGAIPRPGTLLFSGDYPCHESGREPFNLSMGVEVPLSEGPFTSALLLWYAFTGVHPYVRSGTGTIYNMWEDRRVPFDGPPELGRVLEAALVADPDKRISIDAFRAELVKLRGT